MNEKDYLDKLITDHWNYLDKLLTEHNQSGSTILVAKFHYITAFKHGWKHAMEYIQEQCDADLEND